MKTKARRQSPLGCFTHKIPPWEQTLQGQDSDSRNPVPESSLPIALFSPAQVSEIGPEHVGDDHLMERAQAGRNAGVPQGCEDRAKAKGSHFEWLLLSKDRFWVG